MLEESFFRHLLDRKAKFEKMPVSADVDLSFEKQLLSDNFIA